MSVMYRLTSIQKKFLRSQSQLMHKCRQPNLGIYSQRYPAKYIKQPRPKVINYEMLKTMKIFFNESFVTVSADVSNKSK